MRACAGDSRSLNAFRDICDLGGVEGDSCPPRFPHDSEGGGIVVNGAGGKFGRTLM